MIGRWIWKARARVSKKKKAVKKEIERLDHEIKVEEYK